MTRKSTLKVFAAVVLCPRGLATLPEIGRFSALRHQFASRVAQSGTILFWLAFVAGG